MTSEELCLLAAVLSAPDNDLPRLIYADWLEENGRADRAELIRVQCELSRLDCPNCGGKGLYANVGRGWVSCFRCPAYALRGRERELLYGSARWLPAGVVSSHVEGPVRAGPGGAPVGVWGRGFVEEVVCTAEDWLAHADAVLKQHPVRRVRLTTNLTDDDSCDLIRDTFPDGLYGSVGDDDLLKKRWPGVEFELPPVRSLEQALRDDPPTPGERAVYDGTGFAPRFGRGLPPDLT